ncbi:MAG: 50S ribosomal protein L21 [Phenylobacterium sp.]
MYAVIRTGGKQYRVEPGDVLVVEKLAGEPGADVAFSDVLMLGDGAAVTVGAPVVEGAAVNATLIETRKGEKVRIFKKIRRQGYRRTRGHRQPETVLRVTSISGAGKTAAWDGVVDLTPKALLDAKARTLKAVVASLEAAAPVAAPAKAPAKAKAPTKAKAAPAETAEAAPAEKPAAKKAAPKKAAAKKTDAE